MERKGLADWYASQLEKGVTDNSQAAQQLEMLGNYIMYGKREGSGKNAIEEKEISQPATRYSTYARKQHLSLDELNEAPTFDEQDLRPLERNSYLNPKRKIVRPLYGKRADTGEIICLNEGENDASIVGMTDLWNSIDRLELTMGKQLYDKEPFTEKTYTVPGKPYRVHKVNHPVVKVKGVYMIQPMPLAPSTPTEKLSPLTNYRLKHWLIDLKKHQYYLKESDNPTAFAQHFSFTPPTPVDWEEDSGYWLTRAEALRLGKQIDGEKWRWRCVTRFEYDAYNARSASTDDWSVDEELGYYFGSKKLVEEDLLTHLLSGYAPAAE